VAIERVVDVDESRARADLDRFCFRVNVNGREPADVDDETRRAGVAAVAVATRARRERKVAFYDEVEASRDVIRTLTVGDRGRFQLGEFRVIEQSSRRVAGG